jgi:hypothetical protein
MTTLEEIQRMWAEDSRWSHENNLGWENARLDPMHAKYYNILVAERYRLKYLQDELSLLERDKRIWYFDGHDEVSRAKGWEMHPKGKLKVKADLEYWLPADKELQEFGKKVFAQEQKIEYLVKICDSISFRHIKLTNAQKWLSFKNGESSR